jgi:hypothetical protein
MDAGKPILALMYDFDHTLSPRDMQEYAFIPELGMEAGDFWRLCRDVGNRHHMDPFLRDEEDGPAPGLGLLFPRLG